jgi:hypothetical protein
VAAVKEALKRSGSLAVPTKKAGDEPLPHDEVLAAPRLPAGVMEMRQRLEFVELAVGAERGKFRVQVPGPFVGLGLQPPLQLRREAMALVKTSAWAAVTGCEAATR